MPTTRRKPSPFDIIKSKLLIGATGVNTLASVKNMKTALAPANRLARAQSMADYGVNIKRYHNPLERYLRRAQYLNPYVRRNKVEVRENRLR